MSLLFYFLARLMAVDFLRILTRSHLEPMEVPHGS